MNKEDFICNFCGKHRNQVNKLIAGPKVFICDECIKISYNILDTHVSNNSSSSDISIGLTPAEIKQKLDKHIVGQEQVKEVLSTAVYNHLHRVSNRHNIEIDKSNILMIGPTGSGKTLFAKTLAKIVNLPFASIDATALTEAGYVGDDTDTIFEQLLSSANQDVSLAEQGIVFIDEIDKKAKKYDTGITSRDVSGEGVQQSLLKIIEGCTVKIKVGKKSYDESIEFNTSNILFILSGAFVELDNIIQKRQKSATGIGFTGTNFSTLKNTKKILYEDLVNFGLIPELLGRLPIVTVLDKLTVDDLLLVLTTVKNNIVSQYQSILAINNIELHFGQEFLLDAAKISYNQQIGARGLRQIIEQSLTSIMFRAPDLQKNSVAKILFNKYPSQEEKPILVYRNGDSALDENYKLYRGFNETPI